jgi:hypothetical protein
MYCIVKWAGGDIFWVYKLNDKGWWCPATPMTESDYFESEQAAADWVASIGGTLEENTPASRARAAIAKAEGGTK